MEKQNSSIIQELVEKWPSAICSRQEVGRFSGGLVSPKSLANADSNQEGPPRLKVGGKVCYRTQDLARFILSRCQS
jgi:hypothetical protein